MDQTNRQSFLEKIDFNHPEVAELYDELPLWSAPFGLLMLERIPMQRGLMIVDVGAGTGFLSIELAQRYQLVSRDRAEQSLAFTDQYRAYVINYGLGRDMVARHIETAGADQAARWAAMGSLLSEPVLPSDLAGH